MERRRETMDGNMAAAYISYAFTELAAIYPITPSSPMADYVDQWSLEGRKNLFGEPVKLVQMQSEGGAAGMMHGSLQSGALTSTYTSSQGLLLMIPNLYKMAGELLPGVLHVSARSLASNALSIFGDHQDVMGIRQTGVALLCSSSVQECMDLGAVAHLCAIRSRIPFVHFFDGFRTSHELQKIEMLEYDELDEIVDKDAVKAFRDRALNPDHPVLRGTTLNPDIFFQMREAVNKYYLSLPETVQSYMDQIGKRTGRNYKLFNYYGSEKADKIIIAMGSSCEVIKETIDYLNSNDKNYGLIQVHLFRPLSATHLLKVMPKTVQRIAVLDRTKEPGSLGEPLYTDIKAMFYGSKGAPQIVGGRYGIAGKDFRPIDVAAVFENLEFDEPKDNFTVGIVDDVTGTSLEPIEINIKTAPKGTISCKFWGFGSDGTVSANKSAVKIIGDVTGQYVQAYFVYDSKKSGGLTVSHLRFGEHPIRSSYLVSDADFIACHNQTYVNQYDILDGIKENSIFLLNCNWNPEETGEHLSSSIKKAVIKKNIRFYIIDAFDIAQKLGLGRRINMIMEAAFFQLMTPLFQNEAIRRLKEEVNRNYGHQGSDIVEKNWIAIDLALKKIQKVDISFTGESDIRLPEGRVPEYVEKIMEPMNRQKGDLLPVSAFNGMEDGTFPIGTTQYEKRGIALSIPIWDADACIQCNRCSFICPHSVLRPILLTAQQSLERNLQVKKAVGFEAKNFHMGMSPLDCTGCGNCIRICPVKGKALRMAPLSENVGKLSNDWEYLKDISFEKPSKERTVTVQGSQFIKPYFEFSSACGGCGETPYAKIITQLFGGRMMISNSAGCATVWGGSPPAIPYTVDHEGHGPAWGFSLFEDNAEYGLGMYMGYHTVRERLKHQLAAICGTIEDEDLNISIRNWLSFYQEGSQTRKFSDKLAECLKKHIKIKKIAEIYERRDYLIKRSNWIFGGDGWAYDIGYGGLDHVLAAGKDVNIMIFDTEVYSNTGGQASKATPKAAIAKFAAAGKANGKKNLGMMAMNYGYVYVASIAMGADLSQTLKAILEAESYPGPSLIIGYAPCVNHGIKGGMEESQLQQKRAVDCGYWSLYRYHPERAQQGLNPFILDSGEPLDGFEEFLMSEVRFASLMDKNPEYAKQLFIQSKEDAQMRYKMYKNMTEG